MADTTPADDWPVGTVLMNAYRRVWVKHGGPSLSGQVPTDFPWAPVVARVPNYAELMQRSGGYIYSRNLAQPVTVLLDPRVVTPSRTDRRPPASSSETNGG